MDIKPSDVRIGNWVNSTIPMQVVSVWYGSGQHVILCEKDGHEWDFGMDDNLSAIPLTEKWLLDFGFKKDGDIDRFYFQPEFENIHYRVKLFHGSWIVSQGFFKFDNEICLVNYVHEIQNFIFTVAKHELKLISNG